MGVIDGVYVSKTVADFTRKNNFTLVIAYHSQGEVIYWDYQNFERQVAIKIVNIFSRLSGYELEEPYRITGFAGHKDWFIEKYRGIIRNNLSIEL